MEDMTEFMQWATNALQQEHSAPPVADCASPSVLLGVPEEQRSIMGAPATNGWIPGGTTDGSLVGHIAVPAAPMVAPSTNMAGNAPTSSLVGGNTSASWSFGSATGRVLSELAYRSQPTRTACLTNPWSSASFAPPPYAREHIMAERKRREKIRQRFVELSAVIPSLTKMDNATILYRATSYVKELQERIKRREAAGSALSGSMDNIVPTPRHATPAGPTKPLPDVQAHFSGKSVMVRIQCENGKGVIVKVLKEVEEAHLSIVDANFMAFSACTLIITITAKVLEGFTITADEIISRLNFVLSESTVA